ncbi:MAG: tetratricopeptide repeat protein [Polyangiaceae bacterium]|nr:tetratricopeptide repeat protein [Polyangiaceae bacterium]
MIPRAARVVGIDGALVAAASLATGWLPLSAGPGYESALATGLFAPAVAAASVAVRTSHPLLSHGARVATGIGRGAGLALVAYAATLLHGVRAGFCDLTGGTLLFALGPMCGVVMGGAWGALAGELASRAKTPRARLVAALSLGLAGPLASALVSLARFYTSPMVFAFDPFAGFFSGMLYDTVVDGAPRLVTYRAGSLGTLVALSLTAALRDHPAWRRGPAAVGALLGAAASVGVTLSATSLGHAQTPASIARALGGRREGARCTVIHATTARPDDVALFTRDCDERVVEVSATLGVPPPHVTAYLFPDAETKRRLMGAAEVYVAKPWRREVYVQPAGYPHPVLGHEIAHVVAGSFARGPFRVAGSFLGMLPNPGLIEGLAVAAAPEEGDDLSAEAWSRAMLDLGLLPPMEALFSLGFLGHDAGKAYTAAGAFVGYVARAHGWSAVRRWYGGEPLPRVTGKSLAALDAEFRAQLSRTPMDDRTREIARARFDRPAVFARVCPHELDRDKRDAATRLAAGDVDDATRRLDRVLATTPRDAAARLTRATCSLRRGDPGDAAARLRALADDGRASRMARDHAEERLGDLALSLGDVDAAAARYRAVLARTVDDDRRRTLDVKLRATEDAAARPAVVALLIGDPRRGVDAADAGFALGAWMAKGDPDGLAHYLHARLAMNKGDHRTAIARLDEALAVGPAPASVHREALRLSAVARCATGDREGAAAFAARYRAEWPGERALRLDAQVARCGR